MHPVSPLADCFEPLLFARRLFVVGDVHLHPLCAPCVAEDLARLTADISTHHPSACLVFNGDAFDLDRVDHEPHSGVGEQRAASRLLRVLDSFAELTSALRAHVAGGGSLLFLAGNHDAEILLPAVRDALVGRLDPGLSERRVWTFDKLQLPQVHIEHGHQNDPDSAFYPDTRSAVHKQRLSAFPLSSLMTRFFVSNHSRFVGSDEHYSAPLHVLMGVLKRYRIAGIVMAAHFPWVAIRIACCSVVAILRHDAPRDPTTCSMSSPWQVVRRLYLDRYLGSCLAIGLMTALVARVVSPSWWWALGLLVLMLLVPPARRKNFTSRPGTGVEAQAAREIEKGARVVVLGHTHHAFAVRLGDAIFANHGAFSTPMQAAAFESGRGLDAAALNSHSVRPYLSICMEPLDCELCMFPATSGPLPPASGGC